VRGDPFQTSFHDSIFESHPDCLLHASRPPCLLCTNVFGNWYTEIGIPSFPITIF
jgi:hypothetical protein